jgi:periplasmic protein TonB
MFSPLDANGSAWARRRRGWATLFSFLLECAVVGVLVLTPILFPHVLPRLNAAPPIVSLVPPASDPPPVHQIPDGRTSGTSQQFNDRLLTPTADPTHVRIIDDEGQVPAPPGVCINCATGSTGGGQSLVAILSPVPPPPLTVERAHRVSVMMEGMLIRRVQPVYPILARNARIQGKVLLQAIISKEGKIEQLQVISGPPMLVSAALDAVRQWRYRPYILNGEPVEVETQVTVNFVLAGS